MTKFSIICLQCGKLFSAEKSTAKTCSDRCRMAYSRQRMTNKDPLDYNSIPPMTRVSRSKDSFDEYREQRAQAFANGKPDPHVPLDDFPDLPACLIRSR